MLKVEKPSEFFAFRIAESVRELKQAIPPYSELYLASLLGDFVTKSIPDAVFFDFVNAIQATSSIKIKYFKDLGDRSLMIAGVWPGSLRRKPVKIDYYVSMGQMGYGNLASIFRTKIRDEHFADLFADLEAHFDLYRIIVGKALGSGWTP